MHATWEKVTKGKPHNYGPELGVFYGLVDEEGRPAAEHGGIKGDPKPQLAKNKVWTAAVRNSVLAAKIEC